MKTKSLRPSLVITTYNKPGYLHLVLQSSLIQTLLPLEVVVADDGSGVETRKLVEKFRETAPFPVKHVWHEDLGFRLAAIRNKGLAVCESEYVISIDGDILLHPDFVKDHMHYARDGYFTSGGRISLMPELTEKMIKTEQLWVKPDDLVLKKRSKLFRSSLLAKLFLNYKAKSYKYGAGANMAFWTKDIKAINGFDESFVGYGFEDFDVMLRFMNSGIKKQYLRYRALTCHLYHPYNRGTKESFNLNKERFEANEANHVAYCEKGIDKLGNNITLL